MTHLSENCKQLHIKQFLVTDRNSLPEQFGGFNDVCLIILPSDRQSNTYKIINELIENVAGSSGPEATLTVLGETADLVHVHAKLSSSMQYQLWIGIKRTHPKVAENNSALPNCHFGALVHTKYKGSLKHTKTRVKYSYCPVCDKTTKDYGGKKHIYDSYGTLISDVWRDISADLEGDLNHVIRRFSDLFGIQTYTELIVLDCRGIKTGSQKDKMVEERVEYGKQSSLFAPHSKETPERGKLISGDVLEKLSQVPDNSVDFVFADPPYNLKKKYNSYADDLSIAEYFEWCDRWIYELARTLKPGRTCAILNIPLWAIRHFLYMEKMLRFQNWIVWDALSFPVRLIMPSHYAIICFSKGTPRPLPGLTHGTDDSQIPGQSDTFQPLEPLGEGFCLRRRCIKARQKKQVNDRGPLTDVWWDIHRLKHNSRRVDHPCQLPSPLMYRLINIFTEPGETVLDCFNGTGTTTLTAHQLNRQYIGIEVSGKYHDIAKSRHKEIRMGMDPFRKVVRKLTEKNSPVRRRPKQKYKIPKKTLQLEVRRVARTLDRLPTRDEMLEHGEYPIEYYDKYFVSWGEVCAAARHDGMSENREPDCNLRTATNQLKLFE